MGEEHKEIVSDQAAPQLNARALFESALDCMLFLDQDGRVLDFNPASEEVFGYRRAEALGLELGELLLPAQNDFGIIAEFSPFSAFMEQTLWGQRLLARGLRASGSDFPVEVGVTRLNDAGSDAPLYVAQIRDITERENANASLERSQRTLSNLLSNLPGMAYRSRTPDHSKMDFVSEGCAGLIGYDADELLDSPELSYNALIHPDDVNEVLTQIRDALQRREPFQVLYRIRTANDEERWVLERGQGVFSVFSQDDELIAVEGFVFDITERQHAEESRASLLTLERELDVASDIQQSMLPQVFPSREDVDIHAKMIPAKAVGGDFYDFFFLSDEKLGLVIGDVSGKGVPAALFMSITRALVKSTARANVSAHECVGRVNKLLCEERLSHLFITLFYAIVDLRDGSVEFCNAGHNPPYHVTAGSPPCPLNQPSGIVLGVTSDAEYESGRLSLQRGDGLFLFTDGITEAMDDSGTQFGDDRLLQALDRALGSADEAVHAVLQDVRLHAQSATQSDDITALAVYLR